MLGNARDTKMRIYNLVEKNQDNTQDSLIANGGYLHRGNNTTRPSKKLKYNI